MIKKYLTDLFLFFSLIATLTACSDDQPSPVPDPSTTNPHSFAETDRVQMTHIQLNLSADFDKKTLSGDVTLTLKYKQKTPVLVLDTRALTINKVSGFCHHNWQSFTFSMGKNDKILGTPLIIQNTEQCPRVKISYQTSPEASGLQWLDKSLTASKEQPFLFTQSEAIHGRSWIPMQDTPAVRVTYEATLHTPKALRAIMSAHNEANAPLSGEFHFTMPQAIPPYLIALAIGDLHYHRWSYRSGVWAEPPLLEAAAREFEDTPKMIAATEKLYGKYPWQQYDLLILPPSFPFGGMENPRVSFITPTIIAGDKSLTSLISHELAHSWSGNLVTNARWADIWLNEGITSYIENRIVEAVYGHPWAEMEQVISYQALLEEMNDLKPGDQSLVLPLDGRDPDDAFTDIPYTKGAMLLYFLEDKFSRQHLDTFLKSYFKHFSFKTITTPEFLAYLNKNLLQKYPDIGIDKNNIKQWLYQPGLPNEAVIPESKRLEKVAQIIKRWKSHPFAADVIPGKNWSSQEWVYFLTNIPKKISVSDMEKLDQAFNLSHTGNAEIALAWFSLVIQNHYQRGLDALEQHLVKIGRRRLITPLYKLLAQDAELKSWGLEVYHKARPGYHPLAQGTIDKIFAEEK